MNTTTYLRFLETTTQKPPSYSADVLFLIDSSGRVTTQDFETQVDFVKSVVTYLNVSAEATRAAIVTYNDSPSLKISLNGYQSTTQFRLVVHTENRCYVFTHLSL